MHRPQTAFYLSCFAVVLAFFVVTLGAYTRLTDAGLGCPDWPGCYGHMTVPKTAEQMKQAQEIFPHSQINHVKAWTEMAHRYAAGFLGLILLALLWLAWRQRKEPGTPFYLTLFTVGFIVLQAAFGMWTVTLSLLPIIVTAHLLGGFITLSLIWCIFLFWRKLSSNNVPPALTQFNQYKPWAAAALIILFVQIFLGGWTSTNYAALSCPDFPTCQQQWLPPLDVETAFDFFQPIGINYEGGVLDNDARVTIHLAHRVGAVVTFLFISLLSLCLIRSYHFALKRFGTVILVVLTTQILLGISNIVFLLPLAVAVAHNGVAALLLICLLTLNLYLLSPTMSKANVK